jgi:hypothetical protein
MRCPHCDGEILDGSRFCGICGSRLASRTIPAVAPISGQPAPSGPARAAPTSRVVVTAVAEAGMAPIELPISRGARWARILALLALDVVLAGAGVAMIVSFARDCEAVRNLPSAPRTEAPAPGARDDTGAATRPDTPGAHP